MKDDKAKAERYKKHAKEIRHIAVDVRGEADRKKLLAAAKEFEKLVDDSISH